MGINITDGWFAKRRDKIDENHSAKIKELDDKYASEISPFLKKHTVESELVHEEYWDKRRQLEEKFKKYKAETGERRLLY